jgi:hypothetical protein
MTAGRHEYWEIWPETGVLSAILQQPAKAEWAENDDFIVRLHQRALSPAELGGEVVYESAIQEVFVGRCLEPYHIGYFRVCDGHMFPPQEDHAAFGIQRLRLPSLIGWKGDDMGAAIVAVRLISLGIEAGIDGSVGQ